jgi:hypothetical protein
MAGVALQLQQMEAEGAGYLPVPKHECARAER